MFDIGFWELTLIAVIGLIVLGPERLPVVARTLGTWVGRAKGYVRGLTSELEREVDVDDIRAQVRRAREQIESDTQRVIEPAKDAVEAAQDNPAEPAPEAAARPAEVEPTDTGADDPATPAAQATAGREDRRE